MIAICWFRSPACSAPWTPRCSGCPRRGSRRCAARASSARRALEEVVDERARHVALLLLLRIVCETLAAVLITVVLYDLWGSGWQTVLTAAGVMIVVSYVLVGVGPRTLGRQHAYGTALATAGLVRLLGRVLGPVATLLILIGNMITPGRGFRDGPFSSEVELRELVDMAEERGVVESGERNMIHSVFELGDTIAREVMVPRTDVVWIERTKTVRQALALALRSGFSRLPVIGENVDDVVGVVYLKDLVRRSQNSSDTRTGRGRGADAPADVRAGVQAGRRAAARHAGPAHPHRDRGRRVRRLRRAADHRGHPRGDRRRDRRRARRRPAAPGRGAARTAPMRVTARLPVEDLGELFGVELPEDDDVETVGGLLARALGRVPIEGAAAEVGGLRAGRREHAADGGTRSTPCWSAGCPTGEDDGAEASSTSGRRRPPVRGARPRGRLTPRARTGA